METGLIGLPLCGKTTIFNALTGLNAETSFAEGTKKQPNIADVDVPDIRIDELYALFKPKKKVYAGIRFKDIQVEFSESKSIKPSSIAEIRNADALTLVIRAFEDANIPHVLETVDPARDLDNFLESLIFSDYEVIENRIQRLEKEGKKKTREYQVLQELIKKLENSELIGKDTLSPEDKKLFSGFAFVTTKPIIIVANTGENTPELSALKKKADKHKLDIFEIQGKTEMEIAQLDPEEQKEFLSDLGIKEPAKNRFISHVYTSLNLISFLTAGEDEVRAWTITGGMNAQRAAGKIHTDLEKGFIRAEVITCEDLLSLGGFKEARSEGKIRLEGKEYIVNDGDVMNIRFNI